MERREAKKTQTKIHRDRDGRIYSRTRHTHIERERGKRERNWRRRCGSGIYRIFSDL